MYDSILHKPVRLRANISVAARNILEMVSGSSKQSFHCNMEYLNIEQTPFVILTNLISTFSNYFNINSYCIKINENVWERSKMPKKFAGMIFSGR